MKKIIFLSLSILTVIIALGKILSAHHISVVGNKSIEESDVVVQTNNNDPGIFFLGNWALSPDAPGYMVPF